MNKNLNYLSSFFCFVFSSFFLSQLIFSPIYILSAIGLIFYLIYLLHRPYFLFDTISIYVFLILIINCVSQFYFKSQFNVIAGFIFSLFLLIIVQNTFRNLNINQIINLSKKMFICSTVIFALDTIYRFTAPAPLFIHNDDFWFYKYKTNSIMYGDSNFVGLNILILLSFYHYLKKYYNYKQKPIYYILLCLLILTFSRASIISYGLLIIFLNVGKRFKYIVVLLSLAILWRIFSSDGSFISKLFIIDVFYSYYSNASYSEKLLGVGFGNSINVIGIGAHNLIVGYLLETGFITFLLLLLLWYSLTLKSSYRFLYLLIPFLINGFSLTTGNVPYFYALSAVILVLERKNDR